MPLKPGLVDEEPLSPESQLAMHLHEWVASSEYVWLGDALFESGCLPRDTRAGELSRQLFFLAFIRWSRFDDRDRTILRLVEELQSLAKGRSIFHPHREWTIEEAAISEFARSSLGHGVDLTCALRKEFEDPGEERGPEHMLGISAVDTARLLLELGVLEPERLFDLERLTAMGRNGLWRATHGSGAAPQQELTDVASPTFWMVVGNDAFWMCVGPKLGAADDRDASVLACGIARLRIELGSGHTPYNWQEGGQIVQRLFDELDRRVGDSPRHALDMLRQTWLALSLELDRPRFLELDDRLRSRLRAAADFELGRLRANLNATDEDEAGVWFASQLTLLETAASVVFLLSPVWDGMRPLLLLFRQLRHIALTPDLRYWSDRRNARALPPEPWCHVPEKLMGQFNAMATEEQENDPDLTKLRTKFGRFCLSRLKSQESGDSPVEPNENWRWAYVRSVRELRVNPEGRGHRVLHYAAENDPDDAVRTEAHIAYEEIRHNPKLDISPRRAIVNALVWLFQAHYICLAPPDNPIDRDGVQRTRRELARRTAEPSWIRPTALKG